jgi:steroid delta-isomerase-like uncharacterized protein
MRYYEEVLARHDLGLLKELLGTPAEGAKDGFFEETREICALFNAAFPDLQITVSEWIVTADRVVTRWQGQGTQRGTFMGQPATNRRFFTSGVDIFHLANGKIIAIWTEMNTLGLLQQLGILPRLDHPILSQEQAK